MLKSEYVLNNDVCLIPRLYGIRIINVRKLKTHKPTLIKHTNITHAHVQAFLHSIFTLLPSWALSVSPSLALSASPSWALSASPSWALSASSVLGTISLFRPGHYQPLPSWALSASPSWALSASSVLGTISLFRPGHYQPLRPGHYQPLGCF